MYKTSQILNAERSLREFVNICTKEQKERSYGEIKGQFNKDSTEDYMLDLLSNEDYQEAYKIITCIDKAKKRYFKVWPLINNYFVLGNTVTSLAQRYKVNGDIITKLINEVDSFLQEELKNAFKKPKNVEYAIDCFVNEPHRLTEEEYKKIADYQESLQGINYNIMNLCYFTFKMTISEVGRMLNLTDDEVKNIIEQEKEKIKKILTENW